MKEWRKEECSVILTKGEWCDVIFDLHRAIEVRKERIERIKYNDDLLSIANSGERKQCKAIKNYEEENNAIEKIIEKIKSSM